MFDGQCREMRIMDEIGPDARQRKQLTEQLRMPVHRMWVQTVSQPSQAVTRLHASRVEGGVANTRGFVTTRRKPSRLSHDSPTRLEPLNCRLSQLLAASC